MSEPKTWRVVLLGGEVREVQVAAPTGDSRDGSFAVQWRAHTNDPSHFFMSESPYQAVMRVAVDEEWDVTEIVLPARPSRAEALGDLADALESDNSSIEALLARTSEIAGSFASMQALLDGREKPPSVEEMRAHAEAHPWGGDRTTGRWLARAPNTNTGAECSAVVELRCRPDGRVFCGMPQGDWVELPDNPSGKHAPGSRWWPLDREGCPCAWAPTGGTT